MYHELRQSQENAIRVGPKMLWEQKTNAKNKNNNMGKASNSVRLEESTEDVGLEL